MADVGALSNYTKGEIIVLDGNPNKNFPNLSGNIVVVKVGKNSKMRNLLGFAVKTFKENSCKEIMISGNGDAIYKAISCAEIMKRKYRNKLHQISVISYLRTEEYWEPKDTELDRLKVTREIPQIQILLSKDKLNSEENGYQAPGQYKYFTANEKHSRKRTSDRNASSQQKFVQNKKPELEE